MRVNESEAYKCSRTRNKVSLMKLTLLGISSPLVFSAIVRCNQINSNEAKDVHFRGHGGMHWGEGHRYPMYGGGGVLYPGYGYGYGYGGGYVPAVPAIPAVPSIPAVPAVPAVPSIPAVPAVPAVPGIGYGYAPVNPGYVMAPGMRYPGVQPAPGCGGGGGGFGMMPQPGAGLGGAPGFANPMPQPMPNPGDASGVIQPQPAIPTMPPINTQPTAPCPLDTQGPQTSSEPSVVPDRRPVTPAPIVYESGMALQNQSPMSGKISFVHEDDVKEGVCGSIPENAYKVKIGGAHFADACGKCINLDVGGGMMVKAHVVDQCSDCQGNDIECGSKLGSHFFPGHSGSLEKIDWHFCDCN